MNYFILFSKKIHFKKTKASASTSTEKKYTIVDTEIHKRTSSNQNTDNLCISTPIYLQLTPEVCCWLQIFVFFFFEKQRHRFAHSPYSRPQSSNRDRITPTTRRDDQNKATNQQHQHQHRRLSTSVNDKRKLFIIQCAPSSSRLP